MIRGILWLIGAVLIISVLRSIIGVLSKGFADLFGTNPPEASGPRTRTPKVPPQEALQKDPVCGTFIAPSAAVTKTVGERKYYFCSKTCRDSFQQR